VEVVIHMGLGFRVLLKFWVKLWLSVRLDQCARS
jgi:hypothetical protein